ncbi:hypothetical protein MPL3356_540044 [Mesorhizobium plurifarium]|uniref:Uncharacterized protein n=1 Tax=Mesorhizobium plurifarium TaxID=69974 RepID=A0A090ECB8_MESPL|nr:hypothetical protein MPL3356_540044 [Mesorhizobium plurifarium]
MGMTAHMRGGTTIMLLACRRDVISAFRKNGRPAKGSGEAADSPGGLEASENGTAR